MVKIDRSWLLLILIGITLVVSAINFYGIARLNGKFNALVGVAPATPQAGAESAASFDSSDPVMGNADAPVTIIEFSDFQCPYCGRFFSETMPSIERNYVQTGKARLVFRQFPLGFHQFAEKAAEASLCANAQGKFWEYHDRLFENQEELGTASLKQHATDLGLDTAKFNACLDSGRMAAEVAKDVSDGQGYGVSGTPDFFVNGVQLTGAQPYAAFQNLIEQELAKT